MTPPRVLVFLHTVGQNPLAWQDQVTALPAGMKAVAPWLRGLRPGREEHFDLDAAADDVLGQLNRFGVDSVAVCGVGLGAAVAARAALRSPDAVSHLVVVAGGVRPPKVLGRLQRAFARQVPEQHFAGSALSREKFAEVVDALTHADSSKAMAGITASTLVVLGADDRLNAEAARAMAAAVPGARLQVVPGAGPLVNLDQPKLFNDLLYGFLTPS